jgi:hypothetical protein
LPEELEIPDKTLNFSALLFCLSSSAIFPEKDSNEVMKISNKAKVPVCMPLVISSKQNNDEPVKKFAWKSLKT